MSDLILQHAEDPTIFGDNAMDVIIDSSGHVLLIGGSRKLQMELLKCCLTGKTTVDGLAYGSNLPKLVGDKQYYAQSSFLQAIVLATVELAISNYKNQQADDVPDDEKISRTLPGSRAKRDNTDQTIILVEAAVETVSGDSVEIQYQIHSV